MRPRERRWHRYALWIGAISWLVLIEWARDFLIDFINDVLGMVVLGVLVVLALYWLSSDPPEWWRKLRRWAGWRRGEVVVPAPAPAPVQTELQASAEQAERWHFALGSEGGGMAAAEWFRREEPALRRLLAESEVRADTVDYLAWICDALDTCYVRGRRVADLLELSYHLAKIGSQTGRRDLEELAAVRAATAYRLVGNLDEATYWLGVASSLAPHGRTAAAMRARRQVERGLVHLAWADRWPPGADRADAIQGARDRFDDAGLDVPRADLAADIAIHLNIGVGYLYQQDALRAREHLRLATARAAASRDASAKAHAVELTGVAAWLQNNRPQAIRCWQEARRGYAHVAEREGEARCLQHLGAAALLGGDPAEAVDLLERSAELRGGEHGHPVLGDYLDQARRQLDPDSPPPAGPVPQPDQVGLTRRLRLLWGRLRT